MFLFLTNLPLAFADNIDISGNYRCRGDGFLTHSKFDEPTVVTKTGDTFNFKWTNKNTVFYGTGILQKQQLAIIYWLPANPAIAGVVTYQILPNGDLSGKWTEKGAEVTGNEYCEKLATISKG